MDNGPFCTSSNSGEIEKRLYDNSSVEVENGLEDAFGELTVLPVETEDRRPTCLRCRRPEKVCLCPFLPQQPLDVSTCLYIVQHPNEVSVTMHTCIASIICMICGRLRNKLVCYNINTTVLKQESRVLRTVPLLAACLPQDRCNVIVGRRFSEERYPDLAAVCQDSKTLILYPGPNAQNLEELNEEKLNTQHNVILIDGTWSQAKNMFLKNPMFHLPKQIQLNRVLSSQYVIRTQPSNICLSTLECAAVTLSILERNDNIQEVLLRPLRALCSFQLQHGAQIHHSKEHLLKTGMYDKPMPKNKRKIKRMEKLVNDQHICPR